MYKRDCDIRTKHALFSRLLTAQGSKFVVVGVRPIVRMWDLGLRGSALCGDLSYDGDLGRLEI